jgi:protein-tyrosine phosphatase
MRPRWIELDSLANLREVAGCLGADARPLLARKLLRSDTLDGLSPSGARLLYHTFHVRTIVDLRDLDEVSRESPHELAMLPGVALVRVPSLKAAPTASGCPDGHLLLNGSDSGQARPTAPDYWRYLEEVPGSIVTALHAMAVSSGATLVNCAAGKDRTGVVVAIALIEAGVKPADVLDDYLASADRVGRILRRLQSSTTYGSSLTGRTAATYTPQGEYLSALINKVDEKFGGIPRWLRTQGWTERDSARLKSKLFD